MSESKPPPKAELKIDYGKTRFDPSAEPHADQSRTSLKKRANRFPQRPPLPTN